MSERRREKRCIGNGDASWRSSILGIESSRRERERKTLNVIRRRKGEKDIYDPSIEREKEIAEERKKRTYIVRKK